MALLRDFQIVVVKPDQSKRYGDAEYDPDIGVRKIRPQQHRDDEARQNHQAAHGGRALLIDEMRCRTVAADRLAFALLQTQERNDAWAE
jgi:hypothetical protein